MRKPEYQKQGKIWIRIRLTRDEEQISNNVHRNSRQDNPPLTHISVIPEKTMPNQNIGEQEVNLTQTTRLKQTKCKTVFNRK